MVNITLRAVRVLQTETGLVSLSNPCAIQRQQVVMCEHLDAVVVPGMTEVKGECACVCLCVRTSMSVCIYVYRTLAPYGL